jgi:hypothetical protein
MGYNLAFKGLINAEIYLQKEVKNRTDWEKSITEVKVCIGL